MSYHVIDTLLRHTLRKEKPMTAYERIQRILIDNGIPHYTKRVVGAKSEVVSGIDIFECGIRLQEKEQIIKNLLDGEDCHISSRDETITITA